MKCSEGKQQHPSTNRQPKSSEKKKTPHTPNPLTRMQPHGREMPYLADAYPASFQNSPTSPTSRNTDSACSALIGLHCGLSRSPYHNWASFHPWTSVSVPPRGRFHCSHHRSTCCSDRNRSIVFQVKTTSLYHSRAGTAIWMTPLTDIKRPPFTSTGIS